MKRAKKPKKDLITFTPKQYQELKTEVVKRSMEEYLLIMLLAVSDVTKCDDETLVDIVNTSQRYAQYNTDNLIKKEDMKKFLKKNTGMIIEY